MKEMTPEKMIDMFTYKISSKLPIKEIHEKVPAACEQNKFALLQTYGTCCDARGIKEVKLIEGAELSTMKELTYLTMECDKVITF